MPSGGSTCSTELTIEPPSLKIDNRQFRSKPYPSVCPRCPFPYHIPEAALLPTLDWDGMSFSFKDINYRFHIAAGTETAPLAGLRLRSHRCRSSVFPETTAGKSSKRLSAGTCKRYPTPRIQPGEKMPESVMEQIVSELRANAAQYYPGREAPRNVRVVGHTPKADHYIYDMVIDFADGGERVAAKVYRPNRCGPKGAHAMARQ